MTEENLPKDENNMSDDEIRPESANTNSTGENSSDDNLNDDEELDFYDFIEVVSDKFDNITTQSKIWTWISFVLNQTDRQIVEERREDSRKRLRRTIDELEAQKRLLKAQLQQRIHVWSENIKQPNFIRTRDKISFSIGVANACFSPLIGIKHTIAFKSTRFPSVFHFSRPLASYFTARLHLSSLIPHYTSILHL